MGGQYSFDAVERLEEFGLEIVLWSRIALVENGTVTLKTGIRIQVSRNDQNCRHDLQNHLVCSLQMMIIDCSLLVHISSDCISFNDTASISELIAFTALHYLLPRFHFEVHAMTESSQE